MQMLMPKYRFACMVTAPPPIIIVIAGNSFPPTLQPNATLTYTYTHLQMEIGFFLLNHDKKYYFLNYEF